VLWINSIGTRRPSVTSGRDLRRILERVTRILSPASWKENNLRVLSPVLLPAPRSRTAQRINRLLFSWYVRRERTWLTGEIDEYSSSWAISSH